MLNNWDSDYTVEYIVTPLCLGVDDLSFSGETIHEFRKGIFQNNDKYWRTCPCPFTGEKPSDELLEKYVDEMLSIVHSHIMPIFGEITNCESWFNYRSKKGWVNHGLWADIKAGNYKKAIPTLQKWLEARQATIQSLNNNPDDPYNLKQRVQMGIIREKDLCWVLEKYIASEKRLREDIKNYTHLIERLSIPDTEYFDEVFAEKEASAREYLSNPRKYKKKDGY